MQEVFLKDADGKEKSIVKNKNLEEKGKKYWVQSVKKSKDTVLRQKKLESKAANALILLPNGFPKKHEEKNGFALSKKTSFAFY